MRLYNILQICQRREKNGQNNENQESFGHSARHPCWRMKRRPSDVHLHAQAALHFKNLAACLAPSATRVIPLSFIYIQRKYKLSLKSSSEFLDLPATSYHKRHRGFWVQSCLNVSSHEFLLKPPKTPCLFSFIIISLWGKYNSYKYNGTQ